MHVNNFFQPEKNVPMTHRQSQAWITKSEAGSHRGVIGLCQEERPFRNLRSQSLKNPIVRSHTNAEFTSLQEEATAAQSVSLVRSNTVKY